MIHDTNSMTVIHFKNSIKTKSRGIEPSCFTEKQGSLCFFCIISAVYLPQLEKSIQNFQSVAFMMRK